MNAAEARAASDSRKNEAEAGLQAAIRGYQKRATPEAIADAIERGKAQAPAERPVFDRLLVVAVAKGDRLITNYNVHGNRMFSEHDPVGVAYIKAFSEAFRDLLVADGFEVGLTPTQYMDSRQAHGTGWQAPPDMRGDCILVSDPIHASPWTSEFLVGATMFIRW